MSHIGSFMRHMDTIITVSRLGSHVQLDIIHPKEMARIHFAEADPHQMTLDQAQQLLEAAG